MIDPTLLQMFKRVADMTVQLEAGGTVVDASRVPVDVGTLTWLSLWEIGKLQVVDTGNRIDPELRPMSNLSDAEKAQLEQRGMQVQKNISQLDKTSKKEGVTSTKVQAGTGKARHDRF